MAEKSFGVKKIDVSTGLDLDGYLKDKDGDSGTSNQVLTSTGSQVNWIDFSAPNLGSGTLPSGVQIPYSQITDPLTYQLKARPDEDGGSTGDDNDPYLFLDASTGTDDAVQLFGGSSVSIERNSDEKITISVSTEDIQDIVGGMVNGSTQTNIAVTYDDSNGKLNFAATDTNTDTNHFLSSVSSSVQNVGSGSAVINFGMTGATDLSLDTNTIGVKLVYNHLMSSSPHGSSATHQFMMTNTSTGYHEAVTDSTAQFDPSTNTAQFSKISASTKSFVIDHPLGELTDAPKLRHSCIEGPELTTFYRGKIQLVDGTATINIDTVSRMTDGTFVALNRNIQSFTTNETGWTQVKSSVSGNVLTIIAQDSNCTDTISWMVLGERKDNAAMKTYNENGLYDPEQVTEVD